MLLRPGQPWRRRPGRLLRCPSSPGDRLGLRQQPAAAVMEGFPRAWRGAAPPGVPPARRPDQRFLPASPPPGRGALPPGSCEVASCLLSYWQDLLWLLLRPVLGYLIHLFKELGTALCASFLSWCLKAASEHPHPLQLLNPVLCWDHRAHLSPGAKALDCLQTQPDTASFKHVNRGESVLYTKFYTSAANA